jgi:hypothetical protein
MMTGTPRGKTPSSKTVRIALGALLAFGALNAFGGGYYGMSGARGIPTEWLRGSPFTTYLVPSFILFFVVGGSLLAASIIVLSRRRLAFAAALAAGLVLLGWLAVQVTIIGYVSWMQPATLAAAVLILLLAPAVRRRSA